MISPAISLGRGRVQVHLLAVLLLLISMLLSGFRAALTVVSAIVLHEAGHIAVGKLLDMQTNSMEIMPFGAKIQLQNAYCEPLAKLFLMSAAGPAVSAASGALSYALGWVEPAQANFLLATFNLLPALPLDGGRMLYAALSPGIGRRRALKTGIFYGRCLAVLLSAIAVGGALAGGPFNVTVAVASVFLFPTASKEHAALNDACAHGLLRQAHEKRPMRVRTFAVDADTPPHEALSLCAPGEKSLFVIYDGGVYRDVLDAGEVLRRSTQKEAVSIGELAAMTCEKAKKKV